MINKYLIIFLLACVCNVWAQEQNNKTEAQPVATKTNNSIILPTDIEPIDVFKNLTYEEKELKNAFATYLETFHARSKAYLLKNKNTDSIKFLQIIITNFGDEEDKKKLNNILVEFQEALKEFYHQRHTNSKKLFARTKQQIDTLFINMTKKYRKGTIDLLNRVTDNLIDMEMMKFHANTKRTLERKQQQENIYNSKQRLNLAFNQLVEAKDQEIKYHYIYAIVHYRLSKILGLSSLSLVTPKEEFKNIKQEYKIDYLDLENFTLPNESDDKNKQ